MSALCAQRDTNTKLARALRDGIRDDAVESNCSQCESQPREGAEEPRHKLASRPLRFAHDPMVKVADVSNGLLIRVNRIYFGSNCVQQRQGRSLGPHKNLSVHSHRDGIGNESFRKNGLIEPVIQLVCYYANDQKWIFAQ